jgi:ATP-dependent DNA ligase
MQGGPARECSTLSLSDYGNAFGRWRSGKCRSRSRRHACAGDACLSRRRAMRPELVVEVKFLTWTQDGLLRQVIYQGIRDDKPAKEVRRPGSRQ